MGRRAYGGCNHATRYGCGCVLFMFASYSFCVLFISSFRARDADGGCGCKEHMRLRQEVRKL